MKNKIENAHYSIIVNNGAITEFYDKRDSDKINLAGNMNLFGRACLTFKSDDITSEENKALFKPYRARMSEGHIIKCEDKSSKPLLK